MSTRKQINICFRFWPDIKLTVSFSFTVVGAAVASCEKYILPIFYKTYIYLLQYCFLPMMNMIDRPMCLSLIFLRLAHHVQNTCG